jgi:hypothetical protein
VLEQHYSALLLTVVGILLAAGAMLLELSLISANSLQLSTLIVCLSCASIGVFVFSVRIIEIWDDFFEGGYSCNPD